MKPRSTIGCLSLLAATLSFTGCVDPYYAGGGVTVASTYQPGYVVTTLPSGYRTERIGGTSYYHHGEVYYRPHGRGYVVVESPHRHRGDRHRRPGDYHEERVIRQLPSGYQVVTHRGTRYYRAGNVYYQPRGEGYIVVRSPF
jgi:hypothetical protein